MALNLLGSHDERDVQKSAPEVEKYIPPDEAKNVKKIEPVKKAEPEVAPVIELPEAIDLAENIKHRQRIKTAIISILSIFIIGGVATGAYFAVIKLGLKFPVTNTNIALTNTKPVVNTNIPIVQPPVNTNVNAPVNTNVNTNVNAPIVVPPPTNTSTTTLPDTPLAPLRGAIIRFPNSSDVYLIERNGELRLVIPESVTFKNGSKISSLSPNLIYTLPLKWQSTRKGDKIVSGQVDFDPRILTLNELLPFLQ